MIKTTELDRIVESAPHNETIVKALIKCYSIIQRHNKILCSVSGGADSDVMMDMLIRCGAKGKTDFVFFDTGLEYEATKEHLRFLGDKYDVEIVRKKPIKSVPTSCIEYGVPFRNKQISDFLYSLQRHGFQFEDKTSKEIVHEGQGTKWGATWWTNERGKNYNISHTPLLKEFLISNHPAFKISSKCCTYAKKMPSRNLEKEGGYDLSCIGVRKSEGGVRSTAYKSCFTQNSGGIDYFRPIFWFRDNDKNEYCAFYNVTHSRCYTEYGLKRTGCVGCPFARNIENELNILQKFEPRLYKAVINVFGESYEYDMAFRRFREEHKQKNSKIK